MTRYDILLKKPAPPYFAQEYSHVPYPSNENAFVSPTEQKFFAVIGTRRSGKTSYLCRDLTENLVVESRALFLSLQNETAPRGFGGRDVRVCISSLQSGGRWYIVPTDGIVPTATIKFRSYRSSARAICGSIFDLICLDDVDFCDPQIVSDLLPYWSMARRVMVSASRIVPSFEHFFPIYLPSP